MNLRDTFPPPPARVTPLCWGSNEIQREKKKKVCGKVKKKPNSLKKKKHHKTKESEGRREEGQKGRGVFVMKKQHAGHVRSHV